MQSDSNRDVTSSVFTGCTVLSNLYPHSFDDILALAGPELRPAVYSYQSEDAHVTNLPTWTLLDGHLS